MSVEDLADLVDRAQRGDGTAVEEVLAPSPMPWLLVRFPLASGHCWHRGATGW